VEVRLCGEVVREGISVEVEDVERQGLPKFRNWLVKKLYFEVRPCSGVVVKLLEVDRLKSCCKELYVYLAGLPSKFEARLN
jgi:hypothetical protein